MKIVIDACTARIARAHLDYVTMQAWLLQVESLAFNLVNFSQHSPCQCGLCSWDASTSGVMHGVSKYVTSRALICELHSSWNLVLAKTCFQYGVFGLATYIAHSPQSTPHDGVIETACGYGISCLTGFCWKETAEIDEGPEHEDTVCNSDAGSQRSHRCYTTLAAKAIQWHIHPV